MAKQVNSRTKIPLDVQVRVLFRDGWICRWCHLPTVFAPTLKLLERFVRKSGYAHPIAYYHLRYRRDAAPLLDSLAAVIDHVEAYSKGGEHGENNFVTACNKCNARKNASNADDHKKKRPARPVKGKYGEPKDWDGLVGVYLVLADLDPSSLTVAERSWRKVLMTFVSARRTQLDKKG